LDAANAQEDKPQGDPDDGLGTD